MIQEKIHGHKTEKLLLLINEALDGAIQIDSIDITLLGGWSNINLCVVSLSEKYVLKLPALSTHFEENPYKTEYENSDKLFKKNFASAPISLGFLGDRKETPFYLRHYVEGFTYNGVDTVPRNFLFDLSKAHHQFSKLDLHLPNKFHRASHYFDYLFEKFEILLNHTQKISTPMKKYIERYRVCAQSVESSLIDNTEWDEHIIHGDLHEGNIVFTTSGVKFLDLDSLSYGDPLFDIAYLYSQADGSISDYSSFPGISPLTEKKIESLLPLSLFSVITWTIQRLINIDRGIVISQFSTPSIVTSLEKYFMNKTEQISELTQT